MPQCFVCFSNLINFNLLLLHLKTYHSSYITVYKCLETNCSRSFSSLNSFKKHIKLHEPTNVETLNENFACNSQDVNAVSITDEPTSHNVNYNESVSTPHFDTESYDKKVYNKSLQLLSKWYNESGLPRNKVQGIIDDITDFLSDIVVPLKNEIESICSNSSSDYMDTLNLNFFNILYNPFKNLHIEHLRFKALDDLGTLVRPSGCTVGHRQNDQLQGGNVIIQSVPIKIYSTPLVKLFKQFFELPNMYISFINYSNDLLQEMNHTITHSFLQSEYWRSKVLTFGTKIVIPYFLYFDDFETNNPLGSHAGVQKLGAMYISFPGCPPEFYSKLENIFLVLLFNTIDRKQLGNQALFQKLMPLKLRV